MKTNMRLVLSFVLVILGLPGSGSFSYAFNQNISPSGIPDYNSVRSGFLTALKKAASNPNQQQALTESLNEVSELNNFWMAQYPGISGCNDARAYEAIGRVGKRVIELALSRIENADSELKAAFQTVAQLCPKGIDRTKAFIGDLESTVKGGLEQRVKIEEALRLRKEEEQRQAQAVEGQKRVAEEQKKIAEEKGRADSVRGLGVQSVEEYREALNRMRSQGYSKSDADLRDFLYDEIKGKKIGKSAVEVRKIDEEVIKVKQENAAVEAEKKRVATETERAKQYPLIAKLSCGMGGVKNQHINIYACFTDRGSDTQIRLRNGSGSLGIFNAHNFMQLGREYRDGYYIDLNSSFEITAQNASDNMILQLQILDRLSRKVLYDNSATQWQVLKVKN